MQPGDRVFEHYTVVSVFGDAGPTAVVWLARHDDGTAYALKLPGPTVPVTRALRDDLRSAVESCRHLSDRDVVAPLNFVEDEHRVAVACERVDGRTLADLRRWEPNGCFTPDGLAWLLHQLCRTLDRLGSHPGFAHGDLRPSNLLITARGEFRLLDYRTSEVFRRHVDVARLNPAQRKNHFSNLSPRRVAREPVTAPDDIYALGATLYELLTGDPSFNNGNIPYRIEHEPASEMARRRTELGHPVPVLPAHWEETVAACLSKTEADRPATPLDLLTLLQIDLTAASPWYVAPEAPFPPPAPLPVEEPVHVPQITLQSTARRGVPSPPAPAPVAVPIPPVLPLPRPGWTRPRLSCCQSSCLFLCLGICGLGYLVSRVRTLPARHFIGVPGVPLPLEVPGAYPNIQAAVDAASAGQTVHVAAGEYRESLRLKDGVGIVGDAAQPGAVTVQWPSHPTGNKSLVSGVDVHAVRLAGLNFQGPGKTSGGGRSALILLQDSVVTLSDCLVRDATGDGVHTSGGALELRGCTLSSNHANGLYLEGPVSGPVTLLDNTFKDNGEDGFMLNGVGSADLQRNIIAGNAGYGAVFSGGKGRASARDAMTLLGNQSRFNGKAGFFFGHGAHGRAEGNITERNGQNGMVFSDAATMVILRNNLASANTGYGYVFKNGAPFSLPEDNGAPANTQGSLSR